VTPGLQAPVVRADTIPTPLEHLARAEARGIVLAVFDRSAYLDLDGRIVALASADLPRGPFVIRLRHGGALPAIGSGAAVRLRGQRVLVGSLQVDLRGAAAWDPALPPAGARARSDDLAGRRALVAGEVRALAPEASIAGLLAREGGPGPPSSSLLASLSRGLDALGAWLAGRLDDAAVSAAIARHIAGRGPGLTPSGDDLLVGIMLAATVLPGARGGRGAREVCRVLTSAAIPHTTRISGAYLDAAGRGWAGEPWHALVRALDGPPQALRGEVRRVLRLGETSGADTLTGFCWMWRDG
jgi:hypothetical protein